MSYVTSVTVVLSCCEYPETIDKLHHWFADRSISPMSDLSDQTGGDKHPQTFLYAAGVNRADIRALAAEFVEIPWEVPEQAVMVLITEDDPALIIRPAF